MPWDTSVFEKQLTDCVISCVYYCCRQAVYHSRQIQHYSFKILQTEYVHFRVAVPSRETGWRETGEIKIHVHSPS